MPSGFKKTTTWALRGASLLSKTSSMAGPAVVQIGISNACNYRCVMCWDHPSYVEEGSFADPTVAQFAAEHPKSVNNRALMDLALFEEVVDDLQTLGSERVRFIGRGEPFTNKHIMKMIDYVSKQGLAPEVTSNGSLITREAVDELIGYGLFRLHISVNAASPETYVKIIPTEKPERFEHVCDIVRYATSRKKALGLSRPLIHLSFIITSLTAEEAPNMIDLAISLGVGSVSMILVNTYEGSRFLSIDPSQRKKLLLELPQAKAKAAAFGLENDISKLMFDLRQDRPPLQKTKHIYSRIPCYVGWFFSVILADGIVHPCCESHRHLGTVSETRFRDIWNSADYRDFRSQARSLPVRGRPVDSCRCWNCSGFLHRNLQLVRLLHPNKYRSLAVAGGDGP